MMASYTAWRLGHTAVRAIAIALLAGALAGCASAPQTRMLLGDRPADLPARAQVAEVPFFAQEDYYCGPAATAMALSWSGLEVTQHEMVDQVYTPGRRGTLRPDVVSAVRRNGRLAVPVETLPALLDELAAGHPVIVFQNLGLGIAPQWHFAVAIGYDLDEREMILHSGTIEEHRVSLDTFEATWARGDHWGLAVLPPDRLPASADEIAVLRGGTALERVGRHGEAETVYAAVLQRWPDSLPALIGLGNVRYARGDPAGSVAALREAVTRHPEAAVAWHNLAVALDADGDAHTAREAARRAVELDDRELYRETLARLEGAEV